MGAVPRWLLGFAAAALVSTGFIGFLHTPAGRPVLRAVLGDRCPLGLDHPLTAAQRDEARATALATLRGADRAPGRPALGFALDTTTRAGISAWAATHAVTCAAAGSSLRCGAAPGSALGGTHDVDTIDFAFDAADRVVTVSTRVQKEDPAVALGGAVASTAALAATLGVPAAETGQLDAAWLAGGPVRQAAREFRFADYRARVVIAHVASGGFAVTELYQSIPAAPGASGA
jgi:hypothetical protein